MVRAWLSIPKSQHGIRSQHPTQWICGAADEAVLNSVHKKEKKTNKNPPLVYFMLSPNMKAFIAPEECDQIYSAFAVLCFPPIIKFLDPYSV